MRYFEQFEPRTPPRRYVGGESHLYLGRKYRLKIRKSKARRVSLQNGYFHIQSPGSSPDTIQTLMEEWYGQKALDCFHAVFHLCWETIQTPRRCQAGHENTKDENTMGKPVKKTACLRSILN